MRKLLVLLTLLALSGFAQAQDILPFDVSVGAQKAQATEKTTLFAAINEAVTASSAISVSGVEGQVIVNVFPTNEVGDVKPGGQPLVLLFDASGSKALSANMQGKAVAPGWYGMNVVAGGKTSRVLFQVK